MDAFHIFTSICVGQSVNADYFAVLLFQLFSQCMLTYLMESRRWIMWLSKHCSNSSGS